MGRMKKVGCWRALAPKGMNEQREEKTKGFWWTARFHFPRRTVELLVWVVLFFGGLWPLPAAGAPPKEENNNTKPTRMSWWKEDWWMNGNEWINLSFHCSGGRLGAQRAGGRNEAEQMSLWICEAEWSWRRQPNQFNISSTNQLFDLVEWNCWVWFVGPQLPHQLHSNNKLFSLRWLLTPLIN